MVERGVEIVSVVVRSDVSSWGRDVGEGDGDHCWPLRNKETVRVVMPLLFSSIAFMVVSSYLLFLY